MRVLLIHEYGDSHGAGAVIATHRLHRALQAAGVESTWACRIKRLDGDDIVELPRADRVENLLGKISWRLGLNDVHCLSTYKLTDFPPFQDADVVNIHGWHTNYFNYLALPKLARAKPIVATMHDMWHLTGHCAYSYGCERWKTGCGRCPHPDTFPPIGRDATAIDWKLKRRVYGRSHMHVVAPSRALVEMAREGLLRDFPIHQIANPIDTDVYRPRDTNDCRRQLDLPLDRPIIGFVSMALDQPVKGGDLLVEALAKLPDSRRRDALLVALGDRAGELKAACDMEVRTLGYVKDEDVKTAAYSAFDVLALPSRFENQSLVMIEAMACGTPLVAFDVAVSASWSKPASRGTALFRKTRTTMPAGSNACWAGRTSPRGWGRHAASGSCAIIPLTFMRRGTSTSTSRPSRGGRGRIATIRPGGEGSCRPGRTTTAIASCKHVDADHRRRPRDDIALS